jgi:hypothetical protein
MNTRLTTIAPDLVEELVRCPPDRLRRIAERVAEAAIEGAELSDGRADGALAALRAGGFGDTDERASAKTLTDELDEAAWDVQDRVEAGDAEQGEYVAAFRRARAGMSLWFALHADPLVAALESVYEARAALDDGAVRELVAEAAERTPND